MKDESIGKGWDHPESVAYWDIAYNVGWFRYIRLWQTGPNSSERGSLAISGLELYGELLEHGKSPDNNIPRLNGIAAV